MRIGSGLIYIGESWPVGGWQTASIGTTALGPGSGASDWIYRKTDDNTVVEELDFGTLLPEASSVENLSAEYRGYDPIIVSGFYLREMPRELYAGSAQAILDRETLIEWADFYTKGSIPPGAPGLEVQFTDFDSSLLVIKQFKSSEGDSASSVISYTGHQNQILNRGDKIEFSLRITPPSTVDKEILESMKLHFAVDIYYVRVAQNLYNNIVEEEC